MSWASRTATKPSFLGTFQTDFTARGRSNALGSLNWNSRLTWTQENLADYTRLRCKPCERRSTLAATCFWAILWAWSPKLPSHLLNAENSSRKPALDTAHGALDGERSAVDLPIDSALIELPNDAEQARAGLTSLFAG